MDEFFGRGRAGGPASETPLLVCFGELEEPNASFAGRRPSLLSLLFCLYWSSDAIDIAIDLFIIVSLTSCSSGM